jgi:arginase
MSKLKQSISQFGIDDCYKPKQNTKKAYLFNRKNTTRKLYNTPKPPTSVDYKTIILFPHSLGQTKLGVDKAPAFINKFINHKTHIVETVKNTGNMFKNILNLYNVNAAVTGPRVNIGGDHSMAVATIAYTLNTYANAKVIYFDAHADLNTYKSSHSKHYHGMPLSFLTGIDYNKHFKFIKTKLAFSNLLYIGSRCFDIFEADEVYKHNILVLTPDDINKHFKESFNKILQFLGNSPTHISFDVDSIDPAYIPSTGTPVKNGLRLNNAKQILNKLSAMGNIVNMDITELNLELGSSLDKTKSGKNAVKLFNKFLR